MNTPPGIDSISETFWVTLFESLNHPMVRDLAWVIGSPPLLPIEQPHVAQFSTEQHQSMLEAFAPQLLALDRNSLELERWMHDYRDKRLGAYFARLVSYWLHHSPQFTLIAEQLAVRNQEKRTLGEFDLIVQNHLTQQVEHWEIAVKFYLGLTDHPTPYQWLGPGLKDSLGRKLDHLLQHQTQLSALADAKRILDEKGIHIDTTRIALKGRLFSCWNPTRPVTRYSWVRRSELDSFLKEHTACGINEFAPLNKRRWLAPLKHALETTLVSASQLQAIHPNQWNVPSHFAGFKDQLEQIRFFVVSDTWPQWQSSERPLDSAG